MSRTRNSDCQNCYQKSRSNKRSCTCDNTRHTCNNKRTCDRNYRCNNTSPHITVIGDCDDVTLDVLDHADRKKHTLSYISVIEDSNRVSSNVLAVGGLNRRMFNALITKSIDCCFDSKTGSISVPAGTYQVNVTSFITTRANNTVISRISPSSLPGYCIIRELSQSESTNNDSELTIGDINVLASGTVSDSSLSVPSIISTVLIIPNDMSLVVDHQFQISTDNVNYTSYLNVHGGMSGVVHLSASLCLIKIA